MDTFRVFICTIAVCALVFLLMLFSIPPIGAAYVLWENFWAHKSAHWIAKP